MPCRTAKCGYQLCTHARLEHALTISCLPDEILSMIISAYLPDFKLTWILRTSIHSAETSGCPGNPRPHKCLSKSISGPSTVVGNPDLPDLTILKLVNNRFSNLVRPAACAKFNGELVLEGYRSFEAGTRVGNADELLMGSLKTLASRVTTITDDMMNSPEPYNELCYDLFPALKVANFYLNNHKGHNQLQHWLPFEHNIEKMDHDFLTHVARDLPESTSQLLMLDKLRARGVQIIFRYTFFGDFELAIFDVDASHIDDLSITSKSVLIRGRRRGKQGSSDSGEEENVAERSGM